MCGSLLNIYRIWFILYSCSSSASSTTCSMMISCKTLYKGTISKKNAQAYSLIKWIIHRWYHHRCRQAAFSRPIELRRERESHFWALVWITLLPHGIQDVHHDSPSINVGLVSSSEKEWRLNAAWRIESSSTCPNPCPIYPEYVYISCLYTSYSIYIYECVCICTIALDERCLQLNAELHVGQGI